MTPCSLSVGYTKQPHSKESSVGRGKESYRTVEKSEKDYFTQVIKVNINDDVILIICTLDKI